MSEIDEPGRKISFKLVYYGPALSGKTTNLMRLHDMLSPALKGELMTLETQNDRTLFFDLLPLGFRTPSGWLIKFKLFTVPGQVAHDGTRKAVLSRADGVVFVADSQATQSVNNGEAFENLMANARRVGLDTDELPLVVQFNKRDLPGVVGEEELRARWQQAPWPLVFASALDGAGVRETFAALLRQLYAVADRQFALAQRLGIDEAGFLAAAMGAGAGEAVR